VTRRISVGATVRDAYAFTGAHLGGIIGVIWLPMVLITIAQFFTYNRCYNDFIDALTTKNASHMGPALLMLLGYWIAKLLLTALMSVGVVQLAQGNRNPAALIYLSFGPPEGRLFRAFCGFAGMLLMVLVTVLTVAQMVLSMNAGPSRQLQESISGLMMLALLGAGLLLSARFLILAPAIAVGEATPVLRRAWALSADNFWPLLGTLVALFLPLLLFFVGIEMGLGQTGMTQATGTTPEAQMIAALTHARQMLPVSSGLSFFFSPLVIGLFAGASVSAWRVLKDEPSTVDIAV